MAAGDRVNVVKGQVPGDYHCKCEYCRKVIGELRPADGSYYSRLERNKYYDPIERGTGGDQKAHIAKTPLHVARWAVQEYADMSSWVIDPTIGAGTTAVEAIHAGCHAAGMEIEFGHVVQANVKKAMADTGGHVKARIAVGDARRIEQDLLPTIDGEVSLIVNNPPYSGDVSMPSPKGKLRGKEHRHLETRFEYDKELPNLAFLKEGQEYWDTMRMIYVACVKRLRTGGRVVIAVKDMVRNKEPFLLHKMFADLLKDIGLEHEGTAFLKHYPGTLFLNSYEKIHGTKPPYYQTIIVFKKPAKWKPIEASATPPAPTLMAEAAKAPADRATEVKVPKKAKAPAKAVAPAKAKSPAKAKAPVKAKAPAKKKKAA